MGSAVVAVNNNGLVASSTLSVRNTSPGVFTAADSSIVPFPSARRGQPILLFVTGEGETSPMVPTGNPPASTTLLNLLPKPRATFAMTVGGVPVTPFFIGIPYGLVGVTQVNFTVPTNAPLGPQPVVVTIGGIASKAATLTVSPASAAGGSAAEPFRTEFSTPLFSLPVETDAAWRPQR